MRQEHLAAIANLNTFARKRSSKSPYSASGTASGKGICVITWTLSADVAGNFQMAAQHV